MINSARIGLLLLCLFAPSVWMLANIPPLWRDADAYNQLTRDPLISTFWGHGPAYGYLAKAPLLLDAQLHRSRSDPSRPAARDPADPHLTDSGIQLLIVSQHVGLGIAALFFITTVTQLFWLRLAFSIAWASNVLFYTFAHCVGSESLTVIVVVLLVTQGFRLARNSGDRNWTEWYLFAVLLWLCLLSRQINGVFIFLLPSAFALHWILNRLLKLGSRALLSGAFVALAIGFACLLVGSSLLKQLASRTRFHPHSRLGFTFLWRLPFLNNVPPVARTALLNKVAARAASNEARQLVLLLLQFYNEGADPTPGSFTQRAIPLLYPSEAAVPWEQFDRTLNQMAFAFLLPPTREHLEAARKDFAVARKMPMTDIVDHLFEMTGYFFDHQEEMPGCTGLVTFRNYNAATIYQIPFDRSYFHLWSGLTYNKTILIWAGSLLALVAVGRRKKETMLPILAFGISVTAIGLVIVAVNCLLGESLPRYALPMWEMLLLSSYLIIGSAGDLAWSGQPRAATTAG